MSVTIKRLEKSTAVSTQWKSYTAGQKITITKD